MPPEFGIVFTAGVTLSHSTLPRDLCSSDGKHLPDTHSLAFFWEQKAKTVRGKEWGREKNYIKSKVSGDYKEENAEI